MDLIRRDENITGAILDNNETLCLETNKMEKGAHVEARSPKSPALHEGKALEQAVPMPTIAPWISSFSATLSCTLHIPKVNEKIRMLRLHQKRKGMFC